MVPPLAILPILFIVFGLGELSKVMLIVIGIDPRPRPRAACSRDALLIKAQTLGANTWTLILRLVLPQLLPRLLISLRLVLGSAGCSSSPPKPSPPRTGSATASSSYAATWPWT